jgi:hypothetical protein
MFATVFAVLGILLGVIVLSIAGRKQPTSLGWWTLACGVTALAAFALSNWILPSSNFPLNLLSIALAAAAVWIGIGGLRKNQRGWPIWAGFIAGLLPAIFWILFALGNIFIRPE